MDDTFAVQNMEQQSATQPQSPPAASTGDKPLVVSPRRRGEQREALPVNTSRLEQYVSIGLGTALCVAGLARGKLSGLLMMLGGGGLLYRGMTGHCHTYGLLGVDTAHRSPGGVVPAQQGQQTEKAVTVNASPEELYSFWRNVANLAEIMPHVKRVSPKGHKLSRWVAEGPFGRDVEWEAEIFNERQNEMIAWRSLPGAEVETAGSIHFRALGHNRGTEVRLSLKYNPPGGKLGAALAFLTGRGLQSEINESLRNLKRKIEAGEIPTHG